MLRSEKQREVDHIFKDKRKEKIKYFTDLSGTSHNSNVFSEGDTTLELQAQHCN